VVQYNPTSGKLIREILLPTPQVTAVALYVSIFAHRRECLCVSIMMHAPIHMHTEATCETILCVHIGCIFMSVMIHAHIHMHAYLCVRYDVCMHAIGLL
jgi:hypothetical protein